MDTNNHLYIIEDEEWRSYGDDVYPEYERTYFYSDKETKKEFQDKIFKLINDLVDTEQTWFTEASYIRSARNRAGRSQRILKQLAVKKRTGDKEKISKAQELARQDLADARKEYNKRLKEAQTSFDKVHKADPVDQYSWIKENIFARMIASNFEITDDYFTSKTYFQSILENMLLLDDNWVDLENLRADVER